MQNFPELFVVLFSMYFYEIMCLKNVLFEKLDGVSFEMPREN